MSERVLRVLLSELSTIRVRCTRPNCGVVYEMALKDLAARNYNGCPVCRQPLVEQTAGEAHYSLSHLASAMLYHVEQKNAQIEFVIPQDE
jgi:hypothetical protein